MADPLPVGERVVCELRMQFANQVRGGFAKLSDAPLTRRFHRSADRTGDLSPLGNAVRDLLYP